ncbi:MAG: hypothetical protein K2J87_05915, partial [Muribaculaceae bacterium]|nr:hypothetical protein [Muribaculaceae bacterium]
MPFVYKLYSERHSRFLFPFLQKRAVTFLLTLEAPIPPPLSSISSPIMVPTRGKIAVPIEVPDDASAHSPPIIATLETMSLLVKELMNCMERFAFKILII